MSFIKLIISLLEEPFVTWGLDNELCNKTGGSKNITNKHKYSDNQIQL
jgi:hypothetical protein